MIAKSLFVFILLSSFSINYLVEGQLRSEFYADWIPKDVFTHTEVPQAGNSQQYTLSHDMKSFGVSFWIKNLSDTSASTNFFNLTLKPALSLTSDLSTIISASINRPSGILLRFFIYGYTMTCEAYFGVLNLLFHNFKDGFFYDDWVFVFLGISFPRWEAYGYTRDSNNIFGQTKNGSCYFPDPDNPYVPNNTVLPSNALVTSVIDSSYQFNRLLFHLDYFPQSFFGLMTDFNPYGARLINKFILPTFIKNKFVDVSPKKSHITFAQPDNFDGLIISNNFVMIPELQQNLGLSFTISFWLKIIPQSFSERFKVFSLINVKKQKIFDHKKRQQVLYSLIVMDLKTMGDSEINADYLPRLIPLRKWMHVTIHSYNSSNNNAWIQTTIYFDNSTTKIPSRHYEKVKYFDTFSTVDDYSIVIGENAINGTDDNYYFMIDDFTILQGGTINSFNSDQSKVILLSEVKEIQNNGNCITKIGFNELNPAITDKSEYICVLCNDTFFNLKGECVDTSRCKIRDAEKRLCKDIDLDDIDSSLSLTVTYVKLLRNGHQIKITLPPVIKYDVNSRFVYTIPGLENKFSADGHPKESSEKNSFYVDVTFTVDVNNNFPLLVTYYDQDSQILNGTIVLPPLQILSQDYLDTVSKLSDTMTTTILAVAGGSLIALTMIGNLAPVFSLLDMLQIISLMIYINAPYPLHVEVFFDKLLNSQLIWLPNFTNSIITNILSSLTNIEVQFIDQDSDGRFNLKGLTTSFIENGGPVLSLQLAFVLISVTISSLRKLLARKFRSVSVLLKKIEDVFDINYFLRSYQAIDIPLVLALALQIYNISGATPFNIISACFAMIGLIYVLILTFSIYNISLNLKKSEKEKEVRRLANKFSAVFDSAYLKNDFGIFNSLICYLKKYTIIYLLVYYQAVPIFQSLALILVFSASTGIYIKHKCFDTKMGQAIAIFTELLIFIAHFIPAIYILELTSSVEAIFILGWILIALIMLNILMNFLFLLYLQWVNRHEIYRQLKKLFIRIRNIFRKKPEATLRIKRSSVFSAYRLKRMDRLNQEDIKKFGFKNEKSGIEMTKSDSFNQSYSIDDKMQSSIEINLDDSTSLPMNKKRIKRETTKNILNVKTRRSNESKKKLDKEFELNELKQKQNPSEIHSNLETHSQIQSQLQTQTNPQENLSSEGTLAKMQEAFSKKVKEDKKNSGEEKVSTKRDKDSASEQNAIPARRRFEAHRDKKNNESRIILPSLD